MNGEDCEVGGGDEYIHLSAIHDTGDACCQSCRQPCCIIDIMGELHKQVHVSTALSIVDTGAEQQDHRIVAGDLPDHSSNGFSLFLGQTHEWNLCAYTRSPMQVPTRRALVTQGWSGGTSFFLPATSSRGTATASSPRAATMTP